MEESIQSHRLGLSDKAARVLAWPALVLAVLGSLGFYLWEMLPYGSGRLFLIPPPYFLVSVPLSDSVAHALAACLPWAVILSSTLATGLAIVSRRKRVGKIALILAIAGPGFVYLAVQVLAFHAKWYADSNVNIPF
ncbi:MAG: hypothetical protein ABFD92_01415 [Planctomycetaceae bacterium]|nr:hypothetical protein [Planctomycetaceae bacterium]